MGRFDLTNNNVAARSVHLLVFVPRHFHLIRFAKALLLANAHVFSFDPTLPVDSCLGSRRRWHRFGGHGGDVDEFLIQ